jgi:hypothetical protein
MEQKQMNKLLLSTAALALMTITAHADTARTAKLLGLTSLYNTSCEKIPNFEAMARSILADLPADEAITGLKQARGVFDMMGSAKFCSTYKPIVDSANASIR